MPDTEAEDKELSELFVLIGRNEAGVEGVASFIDPTDNVMKPAIGGRSKLKYLLVIAQALSNASGIELVMTKWGSREDQETITPEKELPEMEEMGDLL